MRAYDDGRIESEDRKICFYPFKPKHAEEKIQAMNSDQSGKYFAVASDKNEVKVFELEKIQDD